MAAWCTWAWRLLVTLAGTFILSAVHSPAMAHATWFVCAQVAWASGVLLYVITAALHYLAALRVADLAYNWQLTFYLLTALSPLCFAATVLDEVARQG